MKKIEQFKKFFFIEKMNLEEACEKSGLMKNSARTLLNRIKKEEEQKEEKKETSE